MPINFNGTPGEYTYSKTQYGKQAEGIVAVGAQSERDPHAQRTVGGADRQPGDHGGHLIAHSLGGRNDESNMDPQAANVNQIDQRAVERQVAELAKDPNNTVYMSVSNYSGSGSERPDATMITAAVRNNTTGQVDVQYSSFQNASHEEQAEWEAIANSVTEIDPRQDAGMTPQERALANEYADKGFDKYDGLGTGFTYDFTTGGSSSAAAEVNDGLNLESVTDAEPVSDQVYDGLEAGPEEADSGESEGQESGESADMGME